MNFVRPIKQSYYADIRPCASKEGILGNTGAAMSLDAAARHVEDLQGVVRVVVKETPAGESLDLERSRR